MTPRFRDLQIAIRVSIVAALALFCALRIDFAQIAEELNIHLIEAALAMQIPMLIALAFYSRRHAILVRSPPAPLVPATEAILLSATLNLVIPGRLSEAVKAVYLRSRLGIPLPSGISAIMIERLFDVAVVGAVAAVGIAGALIPNGWYLLVLPIIAFAALVFIRPICATAAKLTAHSHHRAVGFLHRYCRHVLTIMSTVIIGRTLVMTVGSWLAHFVGVWLFFQLQPYREISTYDVATVFGAIIFAGAIPALPAGIGLFEAALVVVLQPLGFEFHQALAVGIALHAGELGMAAVLGPIVMLYRSIGFVALAREAISMIRESNQVNKGHASNSG
jgi:uncharacterized membrane protein YbhN (UPF0104 family)